MASLEEAVVATLSHQSDQIADLVLHHNPLLAVLDDKGKVKRFSGGYEIRKPVMYNDAAGGAFYSGFESFDLDSINDLDAFQFAIRQCYEPVSISGRDRRANRDEEQLLDFVETKMEAAVSRLKNTVSASIRGDGTGSGGREFEGVQKAVSSTPSTGTYGSITRSTNSWAQNIAVSVSGGLSVSNVQDSITDGVMRATRGDEAPDLGICGRTAWRLLHNSLTAIQRINNSANKALGGFKTLQYDGVDFTYDGGYGSAVLPVSTIRLLNTDYWSFDLVRGADFKPVESQMVRPVDQDAYFTVILCEGAICCSAPALQVYIA